MSEEIHDCLDALDRFLSKDALSGEKDIELLASVAYALSSLGWTSLRVSGANANEHPVKREIERVKLYMQKLSDRRKFYCCVIMRYTCIYSVRKREITDPTSALLVKIKLPLARLWEVALEELLD